MKTLECANWASGHLAEYDKQRIALGAPDGSRDMVIEKAILLENNFDPLNGVDWEKGCYVGQELTARTKYRGLIKKQLMPVEFDGETPSTGTLVSLSGKDAGEIRSVQGNVGLALLRGKTRRGPCRRSALTCGFDKDHTEDPDLGCQSSGFVIFLIHAIVQISD